MTTALYKANIYPTVGTRETVAEVIYSMTAPEAKEGGELNLPDELEISRPWQVLNGINYQVAPAATLEPDNWRLDGTFMIPMLPHEEPTTEYGFWTRSFTDERGFFIGELVPHVWRRPFPFYNFLLWHRYLYSRSPVIVERIFDKVQTFKTLGITFDVLGNNCCSEFDIEFYDGFGNLYAREEVRGNSELVYQSKISAIDVLRVVIYLRRTNHPHRWARIVELDFGEILVYTDSEIVSLNLINECDDFGRSFKFPEFNLKIMNRGEYDLFDPESYAPYFLLRQSFNYRHGLVLPNGAVEWVFCGAYFLSEWKISDRIVDFNAAGRTRDIDKITYFESSFTEMQLGSLVRRIAPHSIVSFDTPMITNYFGNIDHRRALTFLVELSCCLAYEDRNNFVRFIDILNVTDVVDEFNYDNMIGFPEAQTSEYFNCINLSEYDMSTEWGQVLKINREVGELVIVFPSPIVLSEDNEELEPIITVTPGYELQDVIWRNTYLMANLVATTATGDRAEITIHGERVTFTKYEKLYFAPWFTGHEVIRPYNVDLPFFIITAPHYSEMKEWFLERRFKLLAMQLRLDNNYRANPAREVADCVDVVWSKHGDKQKTFVVKAELSYAGGLTGRFSAVSDNPLRLRGN